MKPQAVILLSGGIDSSTTAAIALRDGFDCAALTFRYGQRHATEVEAALRIAAFLRIARHAIIDIPSGLFRSALTDPSMPLPGGGARPPDEIPDTYVPARNMLFLAHAVAWAESIGARHIFIGANAVDYSGYPDCRPEFIRSFQETANLGTRAGVCGDLLSIEAPLISMTKAEIIRTGAQLGIDYSLTHSCYDPTSDGRACGSCDSCLIRKKGFLGAGIPDPTRYADG